MAAAARVGAVHALVGSIEPTQAAFERGWPGADVAHLMDGSLYLDRSRGSADADELARRIERLVRHSADSGAEGVLFTGSFFGDAVRRARATVAVPVLTSFDGIVERALSLDRPLCVLSTAPDSAALLAAELEREGAARGLVPSVTTEVVPGAMDAMVAQSYAAHDRLVLEAVAGLGAERAIVLAQFSMERVIEEAGARAAAPVLGPATEGVARLRQLLEAPAAPSPREGRERGAPIRSISAITLTTRDMARSVAFYRSLGFELAYGGADVAFTSLRAGRGFVNLTTRDAEAVTFWGRVIFHVDDVDALHARALAAGYHPDTTPRDASWGERYFHIHDPDGHELSFARPLPAA